MPAQIDLSFVRSQKGFGDEFWGWGISFLGKTVRLTSVFGRPQGIDFEILRRKDELCVDVPPGLFAP